MTQAVITQAAVTPAQAAAMQGAVWVLAKRAAEMAVKDGLKRQGRRLVDVDAKEISMAARAILDQPAGASLIADARETVNLWHRQGRWGPRGGFR